VHNEVGAESQPDAKEVSLMMKDQSILIKESSMNSLADGSVIIQTLQDAVPSAPSWFGEVTLIAAHLRKLDVLTKICERVRFARRRFGHYDVIDFLAVLFGYAISGERTLEAFYERLQPFAAPFMALFERDQLPSRSALSRFLAALTEAPVETLRMLFLDDLLSRPLSNASNEKQIGGWWIAQEVPGSSLTLMARERRLVNEPYPRAMNCPQPSADWTRSVLLVTGGESVGK